MFFIERKFVNKGYRFFLVGIVTGNPQGFDSCIYKYLPDVYSFVGNQKVKNLSSSRVYYPTTQKKYFIFRFWIGYSRQLLM